MLKNNLKNKPIAFIGAGNMAKCIISALTKMEHNENNIFAINQNLEKLNSLKDNFKINILNNNLDVINQADIIILSVKPQQMRRLCEDINNKINKDILKNKLFITIAAGININNYLKWLKNVKLIRAMPNTPTAVNLGVTALFSNVFCTSKDEEFAEYIFKATGEIIWLKNEDDINKIIGITGSAPAYFFYIMELMQKHAQELGFSEEQAQNMIIQTALGSSVLAQKYQKEKDKKSFADLKKMVMSKGGTTEQAILTFQKYNLEKIIKEVMESAINHSKKMAENY